MKWSIVACLFLAVFSVSAVEPEAGLSFYAVKENSKTDGQDLEKLPREKTPFLTQGDIVSYSLSKHSMILQEGALNRLKGIEIGITGFVACVNGKPMYAGKIWSGRLSASCPEIVLMVPVVPSEPVLLQAGYPGPEYFTGNDQRANKAIVESLKAAGKIKE